MRVNEAKLFKAVGVVNTKESICSIAVPRILEAITNRMNVIEPRFPCLLRTPWQLRWRSRQG